MNTTTEFVFRSTRRFVLGLGLLATLNVCSKAADTSQSQTSTDSATPSTFETDESIKKTEAIYQKAHERAKAEINADNAAQKLRALRDAIQEEGDE